MTEDLKHLYSMHTYERRLWEKNIRLIAGIDEAGRGPLAGPVVAAAVILREELFIPDLNDSKCISEGLRIRLAVEIKARAAGWGIGIASVGFIERCNILQATFHAMRQAIRNIDVQPDFVLVDGHLEVPGIKVPQSAIIKGDQKSASIAAASILAKTTRDAIMKYYDLLYPQYGFARNKGYPTSSHLAALNRYGPCFLHRKTFRGVK
ncbi:MAG: ribonuclease HII [Syntrophaceticus schinkii]